jgi:hypothetical protein
MSSHYCVPKNKIKEGREKLRCLHNSHCTRKSLVTRTIASMSCNIPTHRMTNPIAFSLRQIRRSLRCFQLRYKQDRISRSCRKPKRQTLCTENKSTTLSTLPLTVTQINHDAISRSISLTAPMPFSPRLDASFRPASVIRQAPLRTAMTSSTPRLDLAPHKPRHLDPLCHLSFPRLWVFTTPRR